MEDVPDDPAAASKRKPPLLNRNLTGFGRQSMNLAGGGYEFYMRILNRTEKIEGFFFCCGVCCMYCNNADRSHDAAETGGL